MRTSFFVCWILKWVVMSAISSGLDLTEAYRMRGMIHLFLSKIRSKSTRCGLLIRPTMWCIGF